MAKILTELDARKAAQDIVKSAEEKQQEKRNVIEETLKQIQSMDGNTPGFESVALLLALDEPHFAILAPVFLGELERSLNNVNDQLAMAQALNAAGVKVEDITKEYHDLCHQIDQQMAGALSVQKRTFLKNLLALTYNAVSETEGITKRNILIPIEYCREGAKMPTYAHLTDAGMDVFATEEITINPGETKLIPLGIKVALPIGYKEKV